MIGNDIVDLNVAQQKSNWQRPRWLGKLFTASERTLISQCSDPAFMVWLLWSMKESVYKVVIQSGHERFFAPKKLVCQISQNNLPGLIGQVYFETKVYSTQSSYNKNYIHTIAYPIDQKTNYDSCVIPLPEATDHRPCLYQNILQHYARKPKLISASNADRDQHRDLRIQKNNQGVPLIFHRDTQQSTALSISHHGRYGAFVFTEC